MPVSGGSKCAVTAVQIQLDLVAVGKGIVPESKPVVTLIVAVFVVFVHKLRQQCQQINILILCFRNPCEMIDAAGIGINVPPCDMDPSGFPQDTGQKILRMEYFMAAAKGFDAGENIV